MKGNFGSGKNYMKGWVNVDIMGKCDVLHDFNIFPYPFQNETFKIIRMDHIIEHLVYTEKLKNELYRILKKDGVLYIGLPPYSNTPEHKKEIHNELYLRGWYKKPIYGKVHTKFNDDPYFVLIKKGYKEKKPFLRAIFEMCLRFKGWFFSFWYQTIYWEFKK